MLTNLLTGAFVCMLSICYLPLLMWAEAGSGGGWLTGCHSHRHTQQAVSVMGLLPQPSACVSMCLSQTPLAATITALYCLMEAPARSLLAGPPQMLAF